MAIQTAFYSPAQQQKAQALVARADRWSHGYRHADGLQFVTFASQSEPGKVYLTHIEGKGCSCPGAQKSRTGRCFHQLACSLVTEQAREQAVRPKVRYEDIFPAETDDAF